MVSSVCERIISSPGRPPLRVFDWGEKTHDAVAIVNAYGSRNGLISRLAERLAAEKYVISWESRWVPRLDPALNDVRVGVADHAADLAHVMEYFGRSFATLIGFCTGAQIALAFAASNPQRVEQLALVNGNFSFSAEVEHTEFETFFSLLLRKTAQGPEKAKSWLAFIAGSRNESTLEAWARLEHLGAPNDSALLRLANSFLDDTQGEDMHRYALMMKQFREFDIEACATKVATPAFIFCSQNDKVSHPANSIKIHSLLKNAHLINDKDSGHYGIYNSPNFIEAIASQLGLQTNLLKSPVSK